MAVPARRLRFSPVFLVALAAFLAAFLVQSGELGSSDTTHRLQNTHSWWTSSPEVDPQDYPEFGIHGVGGRLHGWYGIGQSLLMLPADIVGTEIERLPMFHGYDVDPTVRDIAVSYSTNILVCVLTLLVCYRLLRNFGFSVNQRIAGCFALLFCTTFLEYTQSLMENNYILLLTLTGITFQYEWVTTGESFALWIGSLALGLNLLTRLTTGMDLLVVGSFLLLVLWFTQASAGTWCSRVVAYAKVAIPIYCGFFLIDRLYHHHRFGSFFNTYIDVFAREQRLLNPALPAAYPFETPFHVGFWGALISPEKSIFLFDPLLILTLILTVALWRRLQLQLRAFLITAFALVLGYLCFYAKYTDWSGDFAWGDRYVSTPVQMAAFISVPLLLRYRAELSRVIFWVGMALVAASAVVQIASVTFWCPLEIYQLDTFGHPTFIIGLRLRNIVAFALGKMDAWALTNDSMSYDPWDYVHITTWNFLPFLLARVGKAASWIVDVAKIIWFVALAALALLLIWIRKQAAKGMLADGATVGIAEP